MNCRPASSLIEAPVVPWQADKPGVRATVDAPKGERLPLMQTAQRVRCARARSD